MTHALQAGPGIHIAVHAVPKPGRQLSVGRRKLPLLKLAREALATQVKIQACYRAEMGSAWPQTDLVFSTRTGRPVGPRNFVRSFRRICEANDIRLIKLHHVRHTVASLLKVLGVPARDAQVIWGTRAWP